MQRKLTHRPHCRQWTLKEPHERYLEAKKSKLYAFAWPVTPSAAAREIIAANSEPRSSHNCSAFLISGTDSHCTDDGELSGTAGRPILSAIEAEGLQVRYTAVCMCVNRLHALPSVRIPFTFHATYSQLRSPPCMYGSISCTC